MRRALGAGQRLPMIKALLFDLDDTLLGKDLSVFLPAYFDQLVRHLPGAAAAPRFLPELLDSTRAMMDNADPARRLFDIFAERFYPALGWEPEVWAPRWERFYQTQFAELRPLTNRRPAARAVMEWAFGAGYQVVIATAPLFPLDVIRQQLGWAGIDDFPYARLTGLENSHFTKPRPEYLAEILGHIGRRPEEALFIGNDWHADIAPAAELGVPHFWVTPAGTPVPQASAPSPHLVGMGELEAFAAWAQTAMPEISPPAPPNSALPYFLSGHLAAALGTLQDLADCAWTPRPAEDEWSLTEIVCHLRDVERDVHQPRLRTVLDKDNPFLASVDTDLWADERNYRAQSGPQAWQEYIQARKQSLALLEGCPETAWRRPARHAIIGPTHLAEIVGLMLDHDRLHLKQMRLTRAMVEALQ